MNASKYSHFIPLMLMTVVVATGCSRDMDDLDTYISATLAKGGGVIDKLPEIKPYDVFVYEADIEGLRSPFNPDVVDTAGSTGGGGTHPDPERSREFLEQYPLDTMRMVGTLQLGEKNYGLVQDSGGLIHRVVPGNYLGQNDGRVVSINESEIELIEIISDGIGGYLEREAGIGLTD
jgi:type IV pilus assembly protein PilP